MSDPVAPSALRSRVACAFSAAAAAGNLRLQRCRDCERVCYPPREACPHCWSAVLDWAEVPDQGVLLTETTVHSSFNPYFRSRLPWRIGTVQMTAGPTALAHVHGAVVEGEAVRMVARTDPSGQGVLLALPEQREPNLMDDRQLRTLTCDPRGRNVLITDVGNPIGLSLARAIARAGAARVYGGRGDQDPDTRTETRGDMSVIEPVALDAADNDSVANVAGAIGASLDIVIHTSGLVRPGQALDGAGEQAALQEMTVNYFGLLRLARAFGPFLRDRGASDGAALRAWVNLLSVYGLAAGAGFGTSAASQAAALAFGQSLRAELAGSGVKVIEILCGPLDDDWNAELPAPKVTADQVASAAVRALQQGIERVAVGPVAEDILQRFEENPMGFEREEMRN